MYRDALEAFEKALEKDRDFAAAWFGKGNVLYDLGKYSEARDAYDEGLRLDPENAVGWTRRGMTFPACRITRLRLNPMIGPLQSIPRSRLPISRGGARLRLSDSSRMPQSPSAQ